MHPILAATGRTRAANAVTGAEMDMKTDVTQLDDTQLLAEIGALREQLQNSPRDALMLAMQARLNNELDYRARAHWQQEHN